MNPGDPDEPLATRLRRLRKARALSQGAAAARLGFPQSRLSEWESGKYVPGTDVIGALARLYAVPMEVVVYGETAARERAGERAAMSAAERARLVELEEAVTQLRGVLDRVTARAAIVSPLISDAQQLTAEDVERARAAVRLEEREAREAPVTSAPPRRGKGGGAA